MSEFTQIINGREFIFKTKPGLFSHTKFDSGTKLLIDTMEIRLGDKVLDLGCGYGPIGIVAATLARNNTVYMVDTDIRAVKYAEINAQLNNIQNVEILPSDGFEALNENLKFDVIVSNPPNHSPKETFIEFFKGAKAHLKKNGKLLFVTERRLTPMVKRELINIFGNFKKKASDSEYIIGLAVYK